MALSIQRIFTEQALKLIHTEEGQFSDVKATEIAPAKLTKHISALANTESVS